MRTSPKLPAQLMVCAVLLSPAMVCALCLGTPYVPLSHLPAALFGSGAEGPGGDLAAVIVGELRLPRAVLALVAGACLGAAGLVLQEALRNPLAVPEMLGVSSGAALGVAAPLVLSWAIPAAVAPLLALGGAALGGLLTLLAAGFGRSPSAVLLTGAAVAAALQAALLVLMVLADQLDLQLIYRYLLGSLSARTWDDVTGLWPWLVIAVPALVLCAPVLAVLRLGDDDARALGVRVRRARLAALAIAVLLIAPVVAVCGPVAWVGFLAPHLARRLRPDHDAVRWLPWSAAWGAAIVLCADQPARLALAPVETPVGAWTALVGVPVGVALLRARRGRGGRRPTGRTPVTGQGSARGAVPVAGGSSAPDEVLVAGGRPSPDGAPRASGRSAVDGGSVAGGRPAPNEMPVEGGSSVPGGSPVTGGRVSYGRRSPREGEVAG